MKTCTKCNIEKPLDEFNKNQNYCRNCQKTYKKQYRLNNLEKESKYNKEYREKNQTKIVLNRLKNKEKIKEYYQNNKEKILNYHKEHYQKNKDKILNYAKEYRDQNKKTISDLKKEHRKNNKEKIYLRDKKYRENNREKISKNKLKYYYYKTKTDHLFKFKNSVRGNITTSFKRGYNGLFIKKYSTETILGCTIEEFKIYIQAQFKKGMSFNNHGEWHLDHIIPIAIAQSEEDIIKLNHYTNFQPLWAEENIKKGATIVQRQLKLL
jgi:hypothetical protein